MKIMHRLCTLYMSLILLILKYTMRNGEQTSELIENMHWPVCQCGKLCGRYVLAYFVIRILLGVSLLCRLHQLMLYYVFFRNNLGNKRVNRTSHCIISAIICENSHTPIDNLNNLAWCHKQFMNDFIIIRSKIRDLSPFHVFQLYVYQ